jgi:hypothetical protein
MPAVAQTPSAMQPPKVLQIYREEVKVGRTAAHAKIEAAWVRAYAQAKWPTHYLGMTSVTGPSEAWFLTGYPSYAAYETDTRNQQNNAAFTAENDRLSALDGDILSTGRSMIANIRDDLSYMGTPAIPMGKLRYFSVTTIRVRPGHEAEFVEARKLIKAAHEKLNMPDGAVIYQVMTGAPSGTFLQLVGRVSLEELDRNATIHGDAYMQALGGDAGQKRLNELASSSIMSTEANIFAFSPKMSYPTQATIDADPAFWAPQPVAPKPALVAAKAPAGRDNK